MKKYEAKLIDFENIKVPELLFKYREAKTENHLRFINNREVFMAAPSMFIDTKDCKLTTRYDLLNFKEAFLLGVKLSKHANPNFTEIQHITDSANWATKEIYKKPDFYDNFINDANEQYDKRRGILSLTANPCLNKMWDDYADNCKGFCIGYNTKELFKYLGGGGDVVYVDELPIIMPAPIMSEEEILHKTVFYKEKIWEYEEEYRTTKFFTHNASIDDRRITLPKEVFNCVILGRDIKNSNFLIENIKKILATFQYINKMSSVNFFD